MTVKEARRIADEFEGKSLPTEEDKLLFTEAMGFLIEEEKDPRDMMWLGGYYYEQRSFDLALKYYEMAKEHDCNEAYECLGYIWYYGRTGEKDYAKAYDCFSRLMEKGNPTASYKIADMYKNGYYVEQDHEKYVEIIEDLYKNKVTTFRSLGDPFPEISIRLAGIRKEQGEYGEALELCVIAKDYLARRISCDPFFGNLSVMRSLIDDLYELMEFDTEEFGFFDLYYLLKSPHRIRFDHKDTQYIIETQQEDGMCTIHFDGKQYRDRDEFFEKATVDGQRATAIYDEFTGWEVLDWV